MGTVAVFNLKGGVGKSTMALALAGEALFRGRRVAVVDADPAGKLQQHLRPEAGGDGPGLGAWDGVDFFVAGAAPPTGYDLVVIDCPPSRNEASASVAAADFVLVPVLPDGPSIEGLAELLHVLPARKRYAVVVNQWEDRRTSRGCLEELDATMGHLVWRPLIPRRVAVVDRRTDHMPLQLGSRRGLEGVREAYAALTDRLLAALDGGH